MNRVEGEVTELVNQVRLIRSAFEAALAFLSCLTSQEKSQHDGRRSNQRKWSL
jgi:hypothetical protein